MREMLLARSGIALKNVPTVAALGCVGLKKGTAVPGLNWLVGGIVPAAARLGMNGVVWRMEPGHKARPKAEAVSPKGQVHPCCCTDKHVGQTSLQY